MGIDVVFRTSVAARLQKNKFRNGLIKTVVNVGVIHPLILVVHHRDDIEDRSDLCHSPACIDISLYSGHVFVDYSSIIIPTVLSDLLHLLHH